MKPVEKMQTELCNESFTEGKSYSLGQCLLGNLLKILKLEMRGKERYYLQNSP